MTTHRNILTDVVKHVHRYQRTGNDGDLASMRRGKLICPFEEIDRFSEMQRQLPLLLNKCIAVIYTFGN